MKNIIILIMCFFLCSCSRCELVSREVVIDSYQPESSRVTLTMVGNALIGESIYRDAMHGGKLDFNKMFLSVKTSFNQADLMYYNQESLIAGETFGYGGGYKYNTPDEFGRTMINFGFNIVSRANENTMSLGEAGVLNSCNFWNKYPNVLTGGSSCTLDERDNPNIMEIDGIRYTLLNYTTDDSNIIPTKEHFIDVYSDERVFYDIEKIKPDVDLIMVAMHWGSDYEHLPSAQQIRISEYLASLGVNIIIGTHPKVVGPIRWIDDTLVLYSLGNFISDDIKDSSYKAQVGLLANVDIIKTSNKNKVKVNLQNLNTSLLYIYSKNKSDYQVIPFSKLNENILPNYRNLKTKYEGIVKYYENVSVE